MFVRRLHRPTTFCIITTIEEGRRIRLTTTATTLRTYKKQDREREEAKPDRIPVARIYLMLRYLFLFLMPLIVFSVSWLDIFRRGRVGNRTASDGWSRVIISFEN